MYSILLKNISALFLFSLFLLASCSPKIAVEIPGHEQLSQQFKSLDSNGGTSDIKLAAGAYRGKKLRVVVPEKKDGKPKPLVIALHWAGGGDVFRTYGQCLAEPAFADMDCYMLMPDAEGSVWTNDYNERKILELMSLAKENWSIDSSKVIITGYSNGGNGAWHFADKHPDKITAAIPMASAYEINKKVNVPLYVIHGASDELFNMKTTRKWVLASKKAGSNIMFKIVPGYSHFMACEYLEELKNAVAWLGEI